MADLYNYIVETGVIVADTETLNAQVQNEFIQAFGSDLNLNSNTPQGVLIAGETLARSSVSDNNATLANQINPNIAGGVFLDAILSLTGAKRSQATSSVVSCNLVGIAGTIIPAGSIAQETTFNQNFQSVSDVTLAINGTGTVLFSSIDKGAIPASSGTLTKIISNVLGWTSVTNPLAAILGQSTQSDVAARALRLNTLASQGSSLAVAMTSAVYAVENVKSLTFLENISSSIQVINGVTMVPHSIYLCVDGGTNVDVANALVSKKSGGCAYNNGASSNPVTVPVTIPASGQIMNILFDRPDLVPILVQVFVSSSTSVQDPQTAVKNAIINYVNGQISQEPGLVIGASVSPFELSGAVNIESPGIFVHNLLITKTNIINYQPDEILINPWELATISASNIVVNEV